MSSDSSFDIEFDYRFDTRGFFDNPVRRNALEKAAETWESLINDEFPDVPAGVEFSVKNPENGSQSPLITLEEPIDDLRIFVGAQSPPFGESGSAIARGGFSGVDASGDALTSRISENFRGTGPVSNFEPWAGNISFNPSPNANDGTRTEWFFDPTPETSDDVPDGTIDFISTAIHEIGHVLGIGTAPIFQEIGAGGSFDGVNATAVNNGNPIPLENELFHVQEGFFNDQVLMDPVGSPGRTLPSQIDLALLSDIGYEIDGFAPQGSTPTLASDSTDPVLGTNVKNTLNGFESNAQLPGHQGHHTLHGERQNDIHLGQEGIDPLTFGNNNSANQINNFDGTSETRPIDSKLESLTGEERLKSLSPPLSNESQFMPSFNNPISILEGTTLTLENFDIV